MNITKLTNKVKKNLKSIEKQAFQKFCEDVIGQHLKDLEISKKAYNKDLMSLRTLTEKKLQDQFESYSLLHQEKHKDQYIRLIKEEYGK